MLQCQYEMIKCYNVNINVKMLQREYKNVNMSQYQHEMLNCHNANRNVKKLQC